MEKLVLIGVSFYVASKLIKKYKNRKNQQKNKFLYFEEGIHDVIQEDW